MLRYVIRKGYAGLVGRTRTSATTLKLTPLAKKKLGVLYSKSLYLLPRFTHKHFTRNSKHDNNHIKYINTKHDTIHIIRLNCPPISPHSLPPFSPTIVLFLQPLSSLLILPPGTFQVKVIILHPK